VRIGCIKIDNFYGEEVRQYYEIESDLNKDELLELIKSGRIDLGKPEIKILEIP
jgi:hypothetical protein